MKLRNHLGTFVHLARAEAGKPKLNPMFPLGAVKFRSDFPDGKIEITAEMCRAFVANYQRMGKPRLAGNYFHRDGDMADASVPVDQLVKSGTIIDVEFRPDDPDMPGLWALVEWTPRAAAYIEAKEIDQISPEWSLNYRDRNTNQMLGPTLLGFGLVHDPLFKEMPRAAASEDHQADEAATNEAKMDKKLLAALLGMSESATEAELQAAITKLKGGDTERLTASEKLRTTDEALKAALKASSDKDAELATLKASVEADKKKAKTEAADKFKASLIEKGVAVPVATQMQELFLQDEERAKSIASALQPAVPTKPAGADTKPNDGSSADAQAAYQAAQNAFFAKVDEVKASDKCTTEEALFRATQRHGVLHKAMVDAGKQVSQARS